MEKLILVEFRYFINTKYDIEVWEKILKNSNFDYHQKSEERIFKIIESASKITNKPINQILEDFGEFAIPFLVRKYYGFRHPEWKTLDVLENNSHKLHEKICNILMANPSNIESKRIDENKLSIYYCSNKKICYLLKGMIKGLAGYFGQKVSIIEKTCMLNRDKYCGFVVSYL